MAALNRRYLATNRSTPSRVASSRVTCAWPKNAKAPPTSSSSYSTSFSYPSSPPCLVSTTMLCRTTQQWTRAVMSARYHIRNGRFSTWNLATIIPKAHSISFLTASCLAAKVFFACSVGLVNVEQKMAQAG